MLKQVDARRAAPIGLSSLTLNRVLALLRHQTRDRIRIMAKDSSQETLQKINSVLDQAKQIALNTVSLQLIKEKS